MSELVDAIPQGVAQCATDQVATSIRKSQLFRSVRNGEVVDSHAMEVKQRLLALHQDVANRYLEAGVLWKEVRDDGLWREWGEDCTSFDECVERLRQRGLIDMGPRSVFYCIAITNMIAKLKLTAEDVKQISISRLREIASVPEKDQRRLLAAAPDMPVSEVQREAKALRDKAAGRDVDPLNPWTFLFTDTQKTFVRECLKDARVLYSLEDNVPDAVILCDCILADFKSGLPNIAEAGPPLPEAE